MRRTTRLQLSVLITSAFALFAGGCTGPREYLSNHFKVGPSFAKPEAPVATQWIDGADVRVAEFCPHPNQWWSVFQDPTLDMLISNASMQNLSLREAGFRVLEARAQMGIAVGNIWPQSQTAFGGYQRQAASQLAGTSPGFQSQFYNQWFYGFNLSWELDFWGRFRRAIAAAEDTLGASSANYDQVLVTLRADVAQNYVLVRTIQQRLEYVQANVDLQNKILGIAERRLKAGAKGAVDFHQAKSNLAQTEAQIPQLLLAMRQACNRLCVLLGMPPSALEQQLGPGAIPTAPSEVAIGIPADLLRRRPDVRRAELQAAAQGEQIGIAESDLYPMFSINGTLGYQAQNLSQVWHSKALAGSVGPTFQWNILNYGRILNNVRAQDAEFKALVTAYQETVLRANAEVENGLATFLRAQERTALLDSSVTSAKEAVRIISKEYQGGATSFAQVALLEQTLVVQQDLQAQSHGEIAQGLIQTYRALGGGWEIQPGAEQQMAVMTPDSEEVVAPSDAKSTPAVPVLPPTNPNDEPLPVPALRDGSSGRKSAPTPAVRNANFDRQASAVPAESKASAEHPSLPTPAVRSTNPETVRSTKSERPAMPAQTVRSTNPEPQAMQAQAVRNVSSNRQPLPAQAVQSTNLDRQPLPLPKLRDDNSDLPLPVPVVRKST